MNYDYAKIAKEVIQAVGGSENIKSAAHCATRLRLIVADRSLADDEKVGEIDAVKGTFFYSRTISNHLRHRSCQPGL